MRPVTHFSRRNALAVVAAAALAAGCGSVDSRHITLSHADLQSLLERQFPRQQRLLEVLDVSLSKPTIKLMPERNRIGTAFDLSAAERISGRVLRGSLALDHGLRYEPSDATVRLANVKVDDIKLELGGTPLSGQGARLGAILAERLLDDFVIYRVSDDKRQLLARAGVNNATLDVTSRGIELRFAESR